VGAASLQAAPTSNMLVRRCISFLEAWTSAEA
jgi:hypothetical protein